MQSERGEIMRAIELQDVVSQIVGVMDELTVDLWRMKMMEDGDVHVTWGDPRRCLGQTVPGAREDKNG